jgi:hypothetical protein
MSCPWFGVALTTLVIQEGAGFQELCLVGDIVWAGLYTLLAVRLLEFVARSFDRSLGRVPGGWTESL